MNEYGLIKKLFGDTVPDLFASDAQFFDAAGQRWGITCDAFSPDEDCFTLESPRRLGANLVIATLSDLYASGCEPSFFMHAITFPHDAEESWMGELAAGIASALKEAGCVLLGGDTGQGKSLSYTGIGLGPQRRPLTRRFPDARQRLYVSGKLGALNAAAYSGVPTPALTRRPTPPAATACIDTSGGFMDAVWQLHELNPNHTIAIQDIPVDDISLLFGGAGEYELLFTAPYDEEETSGAFCIGEVISGREGVSLDGCAITAPPPDPRSYTSRTEYIGAIFRSIEALKSHERD